MADEWLRSDENGLILYSANVLRVIAGREKLKWDKFDDDWKVSIDPHLIGDLSEIDTYSFLSNTHIEDETLKKEIYKVTNAE